MTWTNYPKHTLNSRTWTSYPKHTLLPGLGPVIQSTLFFQDLDQLSKANFLFQDLIQLSKANSGSQDLFKPKISIKNQFRDQLLYKNPPCIPPLGGIRYISISAGRVSSRTYFFLGVLVGDMAQNGRSPSSSSSRRP